MEHYHKVETLTPSEVTFQTIQDSQGRNFPAQIPLRCPHSPCVQSHAPTSVRTLRISNAGSYTIVWTHENTAHAGSTGWRCSCGCCALHWVRRSKFPARDNELKKQTCAYVCTKKKKRSLYTIMTLLCLNVLIVHEGMSLYAWYCVWSFIKDFKMTRWRIVIHERPPDDINVTSCNQTKKHLQWIIMSFAGIKMLSFVAAMNTYNTVYGTYGTSAHVIIQTCQG